MMRRLFIYAAFAAGLAALPVAHSALAGPSNKTWVCHPTSSTSPGVVDLTYDTWYSYNGVEYSTYYRYVYTYHVGRVQEVSTSQLAGHVAHGDATTFSAITDQVEDLLTTLETSYTDQYQEVDYRPDLDYYGYSSRDYDNTNADVGNGNCFWTTSEYITE